MSELYEEWRKSAKRYGVLGLWGKEFGERKYEVEK